MRGIYLVVRNEFIKSLKYKKKFILSMVVPIIAIMIAIGVNNIMKPSISIGFIDNGYGRAYEKLVKDSKAVKGLYVKAGHRKSINTDLILGKYAGVLKVNEDGSFSVTCLDKTMHNEIQETYKKYLCDGDLSGFANLLRIMKKGSMTGAQRSIGFIFMTFMISCTLSATNIIKDQSEGVLKRFSLCPYSSSAYIFGVFVYNFINAMVQLMISFAVLSALPHKVGISGIYFLVIGLIIAFISSSFGCMVVSISRTELQSSSIASVISIIMALLGGAFLPMSKMPRLLKFISNGTITKWLITMMKNLEGGKDVYNNVLPIVIILSICAAALILSTKLSKKKFAQ